MNEQLLDRIRQIIGEGSSVNKVERLTEYVLSLGQGSTGDKVNIYQPRTFDLVPVRYPPEMYEGSYRKDCYSLRKRNGLEVVHYRDLVPDYIRDPIFADPEGHKDKELEMVINVNIRQQIALTEEGFENLDLWGGLIWDVGFDVDSQPELSAIVASVPITTTRDRDNVVLMTGGYTKVVRLPLSGNQANMGDNTLTVEKLNFTFNNLRLACQLNWDRAGFPFEEYSQKIMWKEEAIHLTEPPLQEIYAEPFGVSILDMHIVDKVVNDAVPM
ncbi:hypothetical protein [Vibrio sinaloensis]|uniref:hypothetical protein n=1 Tax=Photobacterium sp. (strain ATCC 43367) TaxID=379097 RepID=UPI00057D3EAB|nr:hypothetical protein [Vibrio sinaloensis]KHT41696.1 hypothetical protein RJ47_14060 [Vibrio sinaloensis]